MWYQKIKKIWILFVLSFSLFSFTNASNIVLESLINQTIKIINKHIANFSVMLENSWVQVPNYSNIRNYINTYYTWLSNKISFDPHLTTNFIVWIHYRENHNNTNYNPWNWDGVFQLDRMNLKVKSWIYCTKPKQYKEIYKTCIWPWSCQDFSKQLVYEYCDYVQFLKHKFWTMNIQKQAIYWRKYWSIYIKWLKQKLQEIDVDIPNDLFTLLLENLWNYLKENNLKTVDFTTINFKFWENKYNIKDFNEYVDYLQKNYFSWLWLDKMFIRVLFEVFQDAVIADYYNWLGASWWSWITKSYAMNIPASFANTLWITPYIAKKPSWRWYLVNDAQVWAVVWYFYTMKPDLFKYILYIKKLWLK